MNVTVIVPTYNEKDNITRLIEELQKVFSKIKHHHMSILVVDDNSPDGTGELVRSAQKHHKNLHLITGKKEGLGKAYLRGMKFASEDLSADVMFEMDADFSHDPKSIPSFLQNIDKGDDLVIGSRYIKGGSIPDNWGVHRKIFSVLGNLIVRVALFNFGQKDWTTGFRAIRTPLYKKIRREIDSFKGYTFQVAFLHRSILSGAKISEVPIHFKDREFGHSKIGSEYVINLIRYLIISDITNPPPFLRFLVVGTLGFIIQTVIFTYAWKSLGFPPNFATVIGAEFAIISNFILNNFWTFSERRLESSAKILITKFLSFNFLSFGSPIIQWLTITAVTTLFSDTDFYTWIAYVVGIFLGLIWNYTMYSKVIWKKKSK